MTVKNPLLIILTFVLAIMAMMVATGIGRFVFTPILPMMLEENTVELSEVIWLSSANYIGYFAGSLSLFKNTRHILMLIVGLFIVSIATFFSSIHGFIGIFIFRFLTGFAGAWALISISAWAIPWLKSRRIKQVGFIYTGVGGGIAISGTVCSILILNDFVATQLWHVIAGIAFALSVMVCVLLGYVNHQSKQENPNQVDKPETTKTVTSDNTIERVEIHYAHNLFNQLPVWRLALAYGLFGFGYIIPATFLPKIAKDMISGDAFLLVWPVFGLASVVAVCATQFFANINDLKIWRTAQTVLGLATLIPLLSKSIISLVITALLIGGTFMLVIMSILKISASMQKNYNVVAVVTASFAFGQLAGPLPALFVNGDAMWNFILPLSAFVSLAGVAFIWKLRI